MRRLTSPLEEPLPLPTEWVEGGDAGGRKGKIVSEEDSRCAACSVEEAHASQAFWIVLPAPRNSDRSTPIARLKSFSSTLRKASVPSSINSCRISRDTLYSRSGALGFSFHLMNDLGESCPRPLTSQRFG